MKVLQIVTLVLLGLAGSFISLTYGCDLTFEGWVLQEGWDMNHLIESYTVAGDITEFSFPDTDFDYSSIFNVTLDPQGGQTVVQFRPGGPAYTNYVDIDPRRKSTDTIFTYTCDTVERNSSLRAFWVDANTRGPIFKTSDATFEIPSTWPRSVPINWNESVTVSDADYDLVNVNFAVSSNPGIFRFEWNDPDSQNPTPSTWDTDLKIYISEGAELIAGDHEIVVTASDDPHPPSTITITLSITDTSLCQYPPEFQESHYFLKLTDWPEENEEFDLPILAQDPDDPTGVIKYSLINVQFLVLDNEENPTKVRFTQDISPGLEVVVIGEIEAREEADINSKARVPLIIQFPEIVTKFGEPTYIIDPIWSDATQSFDLKDLLTDISVGESATFTLRDNPSYISLVHVAGENNAVLQVSEASQETVTDPNNVVLFTIVVTVGDKENAATVVLRFPEKEDEGTTTTTEDTTTVGTTCPTSEPEPTDETGSTSTTDENTDTTGTTECPPCTTPQPEPCSTTADSTPCDCTTETTESSTTSPSTPTDCPITCEPCTPTTCSPEECSTSPLPTTTECPVTCEPEPCTPTTCTPEDCFSSPPPTTTECPTTCDPCTPTTCSPEECPTSPSTYEPCDCSSVRTTTPCPATLPPGECPTTPCGPCPTTDSPPPCSPSSDSNTGLVAGIIAVSVLLAGSLGAAGFLFWKLKHVPSSSFPSPSQRMSVAHPRDSFSSSSPRANLNDGGGKGWNNPTYNAQLEEVVTLPEHSTATAAVNPYATTSLSKPSDTSVPKSSMKTPKEIVPDYEDISTFNKADNVPSEISKPRSGGVKIDDDVQIINDGTYELIPEESEDL